MDKLWLACGRTIGKMVKTARLRSGTLFFTFSVNKSACISCEYIRGMFCVSGGHTADAKRRPGLRGADVWEETLQWAQVQHLHRPHGLSWWMSECCYRSSAASLLLKRNFFKFSITDLGIIIAEWASMWWNSNKANEWNKAFWHRGDCFLDTPWMEIVRRGATITVPGPSAGWQ